MSFLVSHNLSQLWSRIRSWETNPYISTLTRSITSLNYPYLRLMFHKGYDSVRIAHTKLNSLFKFYQVKSYSLLSHYKQPNREFGCLISGPIPIAKAYIGQILWLQLTMNTALRNPNSKGQILWLQLTMNTALSLRETYLSGYTCILALVNKVS